MILSTPIVAIATILFLQILAPEPFGYLFSEKKPIIDRKLEKPTSSDKVLSTAR